MSCSLRLGLCEVKTVQNILRGFLWKEIFKNCNIMIFFSHQIQVSCDVQICTNIMVILLNMHI